MVIQNVGPTTPELSPSEGATDVRQENSQEQPTSTPGGNAGAALGRLTSLHAHRPTGQAGPSPIRRPGTHALAKLAGASAAASASKATAARPTSLASTEKEAAPAIPTLADVTAVRARALDLGAKQARLATLKCPPEPEQADAAQPASEAEIGKLIDVLESTREHAQRNVSELEQQCKAAFNEMARHGTALSRKVDLLDQKQAELAESGPVSAPKPKRDRAPVQPAVPDRMAALEREIGLLKGSQRKAAEQALTVGSRDKLRELGTWSLTQFSNHVIGGAFRKLLLGKGTPIDEQLSKDIDAWLHHWMPEPPRKARGRHETPAERFARGLGATAEAIKSAARPDADGTEAATALGRFFQLLSSLECHGFCERQKTNFASYFSICLVANRISNRPFYRLLIGTDRAAAYLSADKGGHAQEKTFVERLIKHLKNATTTFEEADPRRAGVEFHGEAFTGARLITAKNQLKQLTEMLGQNRESLEAVLKAVERQLIEDLKSTAPDEDLRDDIEQMGKKIAPNLGGVYGAMIKGLNDEREKLAKAPARRARPSPLKAEAEASPPIPSGPDRNRLEIQIHRLRGAVLEYQDKHRETFEQHATLSGQHLDASDALEDIDRQLDEARQGLQNVREGKRRALGESAERGQQAASLEKDIDAGWREALADPALSRLISPTALARAMKRHLGQTPAQMRARVRKDGQTARTGTFRSGPELLRTIADIAEREFAKPDSALRAKTPDAFNAIARRHPGNHVNELHYHGRTIGHGVRASDAPDASPARTGTSQYAIDWAEGEGPRISHLHPWVSPY